MSYFLTKLENFIQKRAQERFDNLFLKYSSLRKCRSYLDIGCGRGENVFEALHHGFRSSAGIDIKPRWEDNEEYQFLGKKDRISFYNMDISKEDHEKSMIW